MFELGRIEQDDYERRCAEIDADRKTLQERRPQPLFVRQQTMLRSLIDEWDELTNEERRRVIGRVFTEVRADANGIAELVPQADWRPYMQVVVPRLSRGKVPSSAPRGTRPSPSGSLALDP